MVEEVEVEVKDSIGDCHLLFFQFQNNNIVAC
jgi:hypothetical protein